MLHYSIFQSKIGPILIAAVEEGVCFIDFPFKNMGVFTGWIKKNLLGMEFIKSTELLEKPIIEIGEYLAGERTEFTFRTILINTPFRKKVLTAVKEVGYGKTASYKQIAEKIGNPKAVRAVGSANGSNTLAPVIPCHRIIAHDGTLGGYGGGLKLKKKLLFLEKTGKLL